jgi:hypothetical protein
MRSVFGVAIAAAALLVSGSALAASPHYTYVQLGYQNVDFDEEGLDSGSGYFVGGQWGNEVFHIFGEYGQFSNDFSFSSPSPSPTRQSVSLEGSIDSTQTFLGFGVHGLLGEKADLLGEGGYAYYKADYDGFDESQDGLFFGGGARWMVMDFLELKGMIYNYSYTDVDSWQRFQLDVVGFIGKIGIGAGYAYDNTRFESGEEYVNPYRITLYARYNLGKN